MARAATLLAPCLPGSCTEKAELGSLLLKGGSERCNVRGMDDTKQPYGKDLMQEVAKHLFQGVAIAFVHRDYCGVGLFCDEEGAYAAEVYDGASGAPLMRWATPEDFVSFFAQQSDATMARGPGSPPALAAEDSWLHGNQTLTRVRFEGFVRHASRGDAPKSSSLIQEEAPFALVLDGVLDKRALLTCLRDEFGYQLKQATTILANLPYVLFGLPSEEAGTKHVEAIARSGGRARVAARGQQDAKPDH